MIAGELLAQEADEERGPGAVMVWMEVDGL